MATSPNNLNDRAWSEIFHSMPIVKTVNEHGFFDITADDIKKYGKREPRLMSKMDFREQLPSAMKENKMAILAISNGTYRIGRFDPFIPLIDTPQSRPLRAKMPKQIITINPKDLAHESAMLDAAKVSGILEKAFGEEVELTIRGRSRSPNFSFEFSGVPFPVSGVQVEVDGGYEGKSTVNLVEAKIGGRSNISVRQILYPQLSWEHNVRRKKLVKSYLCFYQAPILRFVPIVFEDGRCMPDHANEKCYLIEREARLDIKSIRKDADADLPTTQAPFPQADNFETVLAMFATIANADEQTITKDELFEEFDVVHRQIDYYTNVLRWLGLAYIRNQIVQLTPLGRDVADMPHAERISMLAETIFSEPVFNFVLHHPQTPVPAGLFARWSVMSQSTQERRTQTVLAWIRYFKAQTEAE